jgi:hypothetical protein
MSGLPCAKVIIDQKNQVNQQLSTMHAALSRGLGCMANSIVLNGAVGRYPTEEQEAEFLAKSAAVTVAMKAPMDDLLACAAKIAASVSVSPPPSPAT